MAYNFETIGDTVDVLGESPVWSGAEAALYWVDIRGRFVRRHVHGSGKTESWKMPSLVGSIGLCDDGALIVALKTSIARFDPSDSSLSAISDPKFDDHDLRFNDGRVDRQGRFWVGSMNDKTRAPVGVLSRIGADYDLIPQVPGIRCPNSLCWSPDGSTMYFADSDLRTIFSYPFDADTGEVGSPKPFAEVAAPGVPDGCVVDSDGFLWCAIYGSAKIVRFDADGKVEREIATPVSQPTSCAFGGPDRRSLYITTASQRLDADALAGQPLAGRLLRIGTDATGIAEPVFRTH